MIEECIFNFIINITWQLLPYFKRKEKKKKKKRKEEVTEECLAGNSRDMFDLFKLESGDGEIKKRKQI
jgi:hypothetical protein